MARPSPGDRAPRVDLRRRAALIDSDGVESSIVVLDISRGGFRIEVHEGLRIGERVTLSAEHGDRFPAEIRWTLGTEAGGVFLEPVVPPALRDFKRRYSDG